MMYKKPMYFVIAYHVNVSKQVPQLGNLDVVNLHQWVRTTLTSAKTTVWHA